MKVHIGIPGEGFYIHLFKQDINSLKSSQKLEVKVEYEKYASKRVTLKTTNQIKQFPVKPNDWFYIKRFPDEKSCADTTKYNIWISEEKLDELIDKGYIGTRHGSSRLEFRYYNPKNS